MSSFNITYQNINITEQEYRMGGGGGFVPGGDFVPPPSGGLCFGGALFRSPKEADQHDILHILINLKGGLSLLKFDHMF